MQALKTLYDYLWLRLIYGYSSKPRTIILVIPLSSFFVHNYIKNSRIADRIKQFNASDFTLIAGKMLLVAERLSVVARGLSPDVFCLYSCVNQQLKSSVCKSAALCARFC